MQKYRWVVLSQMFVAYLHVMFESPSILLIKLIKVPAGVVYVDPGFKGDSQRFLPLNCFDLTGSFDATISSYKLHDVMP